MTDIVAVAVIHERYKTMANATFWFDVSCPYCWLTSRWLKEVQQHRDLAVHWVPMSLSVLNEGRDLAPDYMDKMKANWGPARVFAKVATENPDKVDELYTELGTMIHHGGEGGKQGFGAYDELIRQALAKVGLDPSIAEVANTTEYDDQLRRFHGQAMAAVGDEVGTPVIQFNDVAFFGPVITRVPRGSQAVELFDACVQLASYPHFFELKRTRTERPQL
ncbi:2-hydroxychromene-2-carboxylate isomerase [Corynebacterium mustelae]|uniref:2-hydroxychromene-2-carboxylate isomerase n=2 Tax=Corynebacterium mustelae TaxID=571915 RepID=A0A0G3H016_9CORY|nr:2-hydroxychromene-2-carboxylate isomerase [Corynebacterium mustelae]